MAEPLDFELEIGQAADAGYPVTARVKGGGEAGGIMSWSLTGRQLDAQLAAIRDSVLASSATVRRLSTLDEQPVRDFGQRLFDAAIRDEIRLLYGSAYQQSRQQDRSLRLVLRIRPPELARLPWEYLFDRSDDAYLGLRMPLVRYPQVLEPQRPLKVNPPLHVLAMVARPADQAALDVRSEKHLLETALAELERAGHVKLTWVRGQSWRDLRATLDSGAWHVFHFIGHGGFNAQSGEGVLALAGEEGGTSPLGAGALSMVLSENFPLRLVVLNACDTGRSSSLDSFSSVAGALVRRGIPAILAMQFEITDRAAIEFTRTFYEELAHRKPVDACAMRARQAIYIAQTDSLEWGTPVLYLRSSDGRIFDVSEPAPGEEVRLQRDSQAEESASLRKRYAQGLAAFYTERWEDAVGIFRQLLAEQPDYPDASLKLQQALKQARLLASYAEAVEAVKESRWKAAVEAFEAVLAVDSGYRDAGQQLEEARTRNRIAELQDEARRLYGEQHWEAVVRIGEQLATIDSQSGDPDGIVTEARRSLQAAQQAELQAEQYTVALEHIDSGAWQEARVALESVEELGPGYEDTQALLAMIEGRLAQSQATSPPRPQEAVGVGQDQGTSTGPDREPVQLDVARPAIIGVMGHQSGRTTDSAISASADQKPIVPSWVIAAAGMLLVLGLLATFAISYWNSQNGSCLTCPALANKPSQVVFSDDFSSDKGWNKTTYQLQAGHPGTLRLSEPAKAASPVRAPTPVITSYGSLKIEVQLVVSSGGGLFNLNCYNSSGTTYEFQAAVGSSTYYIYDYDHGKDVNSGSGPAMNLGESHTLTAICYSDAGATDLELLVDGHTVVRGRANSYGGPWQPQVGADAFGADMAIDFKQFTVSKVS